MGYKTGPGVTGTGNDMETVKIHSGIVKVLMMVNAGAITQDELEYQINMIVRDWLIRVLTKTIENLG